MKKIWIIVATVVIVVGIGLGAAGYVYAQNVNPPSNGTGTPGYGYGMMGGRGMMGGYADGDFGPMHDLMISAWADKLGLTVDELNAKLNAGQTMLEVATAQGISGDAFTTAWQDVHTKVWDEAVAQGIITEAQAQLMKDRMQQRLDNGWNPGTTGTGAGCPMWGGTGTGTGTPQGGNGFRRGGMMGNGYGMMGGGFNR